MYEYFGDDERMDRMKESYKIEEAELRNWNKTDDDGELYGDFADDEEMITAWVNGADDDDEVRAYSAELDRLLEMNVDIEV